MQVREGELNKIKELEAELKKKQARIETLEIKAKPRSLGFYRSRFR